MLIICFIISVLNFSKYFSYKNEISKQDEKIQEIRALNNLPNSSIQTDSIINSNKKIAQKELNKREGILYILSNNKIDVKDIILENDVLEINVLNTDKKKIEEYISGKYKIISSSISGLNLNIKVQLWID